MMKTISDIVNEARIPIDPELKRQRDNLKQRIREWKAKGKDTSPLDAQLVEIMNKIADMQAATAVPTPNSTGNTITTTAAPRQAAAKRTATPKATAKKTTTKPSNQSADWKEGYEAAIKAIKEMQKKGGHQNQQNGGGDGDGSGLEGIPSDPSDMQGGDQGSEDGTQKGQSGAGGSSGRSRNGKQQGTGVVRPEDCVDPSRGLSKVPSTAGGMISKEDGDQIAEAEGYEPEGGNDSSVDKDWSERAKRAASQMQGKNAGYDKLKAKLDGLYRTTKDWKKELKKIVGHSISPDDKRSAYANKNILISQNRIARTDKDKYDNMDYMMAWIDTSGSMSQEYMEQCLQEVYQVALAKKPLKLVIVQFDTRIADIQEFKSVQDLKRSMKGYTIKGGGGTEVKPCFDMLLKDPKYNRMPCELVMIFTDGYLDQYKRNPKTMRNLVWVIVDNVGFNLQYKDINTKCIRLSTQDFYGN